MTDQPRYELKYVVELATIAALRRELDDVMTVDPHAGPGGGYQVSSLYYDGPDHEAYFEKLDGERRRFKIRLRTYDPGDELGAVFLEAKHRDGNLIRKDRAPMDAEAARRVADLPTLPPEPEDWTQAGRTADLLRGVITGHALRPACVVGYHRLPLVARIDPTLRVTLDTRIEAWSPRPPWEALPGSGVQVLPVGLGVVELKFHWAAPLWLIDVCQSLGLRMRRYSKYCSALERVLPSVAHRSVTFQPSSSD